MDVPAANGMIKLSSNSILWISIIIDSKSIAMKLPATAKIGWTKNIANKELIIKPAICFFFCQ